MLKKQVFDTDSAEAVDSRIIKRDWHWHEVTTAEALDSLAQGAKYAGESFGRHHIQREREQIAALRNSIIDNNEAARQVEAQQAANVADVPRQQYAEYLRQLGALIAKSARASGGTRCGIIPVPPPPDLSDMRWRKQTRLPLASYKTMDERIADAQAVRGGVAAWLEELAEQDF